MGWKYGQILSTDITCSKERTAFQQSSSRKTVSLEEHSDNVQGQISEHIFAPKEGYCVYYPSNIMGDKLLLNFGAKFQP